ncbi:phenylalanine--tRNA ligase subunit beta [Flavobacteriaceae bacterium Ap0902]|nr:phenylalanine--tRNA ligase subunit beta [Flavobacteriaceae bacterium Ap0902]
MKISHNWLKDFIKTDLSDDKISEILTDIGLEVEGIAHVGISKEDLENFVVGEVVSCEKHPNADKLKITEVNLGSETVQIVCGAPNVALGQKVPVAKPGAIIKDDKGGAFKIKKAKLRGEVSNGMICSKKELRISHDHAGIWVMDTELMPGTPLSEILDTSTDAVFEIGLTPNRADAMSHFGVARDLHVALKARKLNSVYQKPEIKEIPKSTAKNPIEVEIKDSELCPRYAGLYIKNVKVEESPLWLQKRLQSIGLFPKNNVVDITNYILHHVGQPMHAFDADKIKGNKIIVSTASKGSKFHTLDKAERTLNGNELMIQDAHSNLAIAGVMGGLESAVNNETANIFLESAYFNPVSVRKTSKAHAINSDSSFRFERGIDPHFTVKALKLAANLILEIAGGEIVGEIADNYPKPINNFTAVLQYRKVDQLLGERLHRNTIKDILKLLEIDIISETPTSLELEIPAYRVDVRREADLIEEILRIYGYNSLLGNEKVSFSIVPGEGFEKDKIINTLADSLVALGFNEAMNLSMYNEELNQLFGFEDDQSIPILNALSSDLSVLRRSLYPALLKNVDYNLKRKQEQIKFFELGNTYQKKGDEFIEDQVLTMVVSGSQHAVHWDNPEKEVDIFYLKGIINHLLSKFKLNDIQWEEHQDVFSVYTLKGFIHNKEIVKLGSFNKETLKRFDIDQVVYFAEINLENFINTYLNRKETVFKELSKFPQVKRDLALLIDKQITYQTIVETIHELNNPLIKSVDLFDVYEGDKLPADKKSYAISLVLLDENKTMKDKQIDEIMNQVIKILKKELNVELR